MEMAKPPEQKPSRALLQSNSHPPTSKPLLKMETTARNRPETSAPSDASRTMTLTRGPTRQEGDDIADEGAGSSQSLGVLRLRAKSTGNRVAWGEDVVDNEGAGKKKSKICCIYHKPKRYDESSSDSSDSEDEHRHTHSAHPHSHGHDHALQSTPGSSQQSQSEVHTPDLSDDAEPNAYEQGPGRSKGKGTWKAAP